MYAVYRAPNKTLTTVYSLFTQLLCSKLSAPLIFSQWLPQQGNFSTALFPVLRRPQLCLCGLALMDLCLTFGLCYLADVSGQASVDFFPQYPCNTFGPNGFFLKMAATRNQVVDDRANQQFPFTLYRLLREAFHPPPAIDVEVQQSYKSKKGNMII